MSISELRKQVWEQLVEFAWSQWAQLGVSSHALRSDRWAMDPEALILFTIEVGRRDPRLFDEMLDWLGLNASLLSLQRLRNLTPRFRIDRDLVGASTAWVTEETPSVRWHKAGPRGTGAGVERLPVFSPEVAAFTGELDPVFERFGYLRSKATRSGKSRAPDLRARINLAFRLRLLFGVGTRSEVMRILLTSTEGPLDAARIADEAGFAKRNINDALTALAESGVVKERWSGNKRVFLAYRKKWAEVLEIGPKAEDLPTFVSWVHLLPPLVEVLRWLEEIDETEETPYMLSSRARDLIERIRGDLEMADVPVPTGEAAPGEAYLPHFENTVGSILSAIDGDG